MKGQLYINGKDAYTTWGVSMGDNFLNNIETPAAIKDLPSNESRTEHGKRVITNASVVRLASRDVTLQFQICGSTQDDYLNKKKAFQTELQKGAVDISIPSRGDEVDHLIYQGKQVSFSQTISEGKLSAKFEEPNPADRV